MCRRARPDETNARRVGKIVDRALTFARDLLTILPTPNVRPRGHCTSAAVSKGERVQCPPYGALGS